jgi:hypothetical protein
MAAANNRRIATHTRAVAFYLEHARRTPYCVVDY